MQQERYEDAVDAFTHAVDLAPMDSRWLNHRRAAYAEMERFDEAAQDLQRIEWLSGLEQLTRKAQGSPANPDVWITRAQYLMRQDQYGAAIQDFTRAIVVQPGHPEALCGRALAWLETGDYQKAIADCDESIVSSPSRNAYSIRASVWRALDNLDQAINDYESAELLNEVVAEAYEQRAEKLAEAGEAEQAAADRQRATTIRETLAGKRKSADSEAPALPPEAVKQ